jgi:aerobic C4-dicarboxylate transport protein
MAPACTLRACRCFSRRPVGIDLSIGQQLGLLAILLATSKGGAGVAGSAIVVLASTLSATGTIPVASVGLILGVHRLLSSAFVPVNVLGQRDRDASHRPHGTRESMWRRWSWSFGQV